MFDAIGKLKELQAGLEDGKGHIGAQISAQQAAMDTFESAGVVDAKTKLLVAIGAIALTRCDNCAVLHLPKLVALGATKDEVMEAAAVGMSFGGGPSMAFISTVIAPAYDQFAAAAAAGEGTQADGLFG